MAWLEFQTATIGGVLKRELFTADGTWTKPDRIVGGMAYVTLIGGGSSGASTDLEMAGASGQYFVRFPVDVSAVSSVAVTIGQGGALVNGGGSNTAGNPGTASSFGAFISAAGGPAPGTLSTYLTPLNGSNPGKSTNSNEAARPIPGSFGASVNYFRGSLEPIGASGLILGDTVIKAGDAGAGGSKGLGGFGYGAGGSGAENNQDSGAGAPGAVLVEWIEEP